MKKAARKRTAFLILSATGPERAPLGQAEALSHKTPADDAQPAMFFSREELGALTSRSSATSVPSSLGFFYVSYKFPPEQKSNIFLAF
jgi:hypothetical protein